MKLITTVVFILLSVSVKANNISCVTYNVNYSFINKKIVPLLEEINADVVILQETNAEWEDIIRSGLQYKYTYIKFRNIGSASGLAVLSKYPIVEIKYLKNKPGWFRSGVVTIKKEQDTIQFLNVHLKPPLSKKGLIGWNAYFKADEVHVEEIKQFMDSLNPKLPTIILGDFNENDKGKCLRWLKNKMDFTDALPLFDKRTRTWRFVLLRGRYDHIVFSKKLSCIHARVYKEGKSDHFPVFGEFKIN